MKFIFALLLTLGASASATTNYEYFEDLSVDPATVLANLVVDRTMKTYSVRVANCAEAVSSIMLRIQEAGLEVNGAGVTYTDGSSDGYSISYSFPADYDSPWISIDSFKDAGKCVKSVYVNARSTDPDRNSRVRVFGR